MADTTETTTNRTTTDTSTTDTPTVSESTTVTSGATVTGQAFQNGEISIDKDARATTTNDTTQTLEDNIADSKALAMHNHAVEHANDPTPTTGDKTVV